MTKRTSVLLLAWAFLGLVLVVVGGYLTDSAYLNGFGGGVSATVFLVWAVERRVRAS